MIRRPIREFIQMWDEGEFDKTVNSMISAGWYDWFCTDKGMYSRTKAMVPAIRRIAKSSKVDQDMMYVFFKNNCPGWVQTTYDDFRICDMETGNVLYTIIPRYPCPHQRARKRRGRTLRAFSENHPTKQGYVSTVWDFVISEEERIALHIENLAQGKAIDYDECVVHGDRKEMYSYFGV